MSKFATALCDILDRTDFFDRKEWAKFLAVDPLLISDWLTDTSVPRRDLLHMIYLALTNYDVDQHYVQEFEKVAKMDSMEVSPHGQEMSPTVWEYMHRSPFQ